MILIRPATLFALVASILAGCGQPETFLVGEREPIRDLVPISEAPRSDRVTPVRLPPQTRNEAWLQGPGSPVTRIEHAALGTDLAVVWSAPIGEGDSTRQRITAAPVIADERIFTMDSASTVVATSTDGQRLWERSVVPDKELGGTTAGGGLALGQDALVVTNGFESLLALDPATGEVFWSQNLYSAANSPPLIHGGSVWVVTGDGTAMAIDMTSGRIRWQIDGVGDISNVMGSNAPILAGRLVILPVGTNELRAVFPGGGLRLWTDVIAGRRPGLAFARISDITGGPLAADGRVYAATSSGRTVALDSATGERLWTAPAGATGHLWSVAGAFFMISDLGELQRRNADTGELLWSVELPYFVPRRPRRRVDIYVHHGPVLAGGRLYVASSDGYLRAFSPDDGQLLEQIPVNGGASTAPVVADGKLYLVSARGVLHAFR